MGLFSKYKREPLPGHPGGVRWNYDGPITYNPDKGLYEDRSGQTSFEELRARFQPESTPNAFTRLLTGVSEVATSLGLRKTDTPKITSEKPPRFDP